MTVAQTAAEAFDLYQAALTDHRLIQHAWHKEQDGRDLVCALSALGTEIDSVEKCPAQIMPRWLAQNAVWLFDGQSFDDAASWGLRFYAELKRLNGVVPFLVIHDWHATVVGPFAIEVGAKRKRKVAVHEDLVKMQADALAGKKFSAEEWRPILRAAFFDANAYAHADADAYAYAYANAYADADANAYAYANAYADAYANANADADADAYADAADAYADANAYAYANAKQKSIKRLADGLVDCLARVSI